jgi:hypothetical protein
LRNRFGLKRPGLDVYRQGKDFVKNNSMISFSKNSTAASSFLSEAFMLAVFLPMRRKTARREKPHELGLS